MKNELPLVEQLLSLVRPAVPGLSNLKVDPLTADLRQAGLSSMAAARLMLEIESLFNIAIPDADLVPDNFATVRAIERLVVRLRA
jgi:acyl carrier protein